MPDEGRRMDGSLVDLGMARQVPSKRPETTASFGADLPKTNSRKPLCALKKHLLFECPRSGRPDSAEPSGVESTCCCSATTCCFPHLKLARELLRKASYWLALLTTAPAMSGGRCRN
jgi:hypothetical protein